MCTPSTINIDLIWLDTKMVAFEKVTYKTWEFWTYPFVKFLPESLFRRQRVCLLRAPLVWRLEKDLRNTRQNEFVLRVVSCHDDWWHIISNSLSMSWVCKLNCYSKKLGEHQKSPLETLGQTNQHPNLHRSPRLVRQAQRLISGWEFKSSTSWDHWISFSKITSRWQFIYGACDWTCFALEVLTHWISFCSRVTT